MNKPLPHPWKDISSYSKNEDRTPRTWEAHFGEFKLVLTRHIHHAPDVWVTSCDGLFDRLEMTNKDLHGAAQEAKRKLSTRLETALHEIHQS